MILKNFSSSMHKNSNETVGFVNVTVKRNYEYQTHTDNRDAFMESCRYG